MDQYLMDQYLMDQYLMDQVEQRKVEWVVDPLDKQEPIECEHSLALPQKRLKQKIRDCCEFAHSWYRHASIC
jgi:hypothetical protein